MKEHGRRFLNNHNYRDVHMPNSTHTGVFIGIFMLVGGFFLTFQSIILFLIHVAGISGTMIYQGLAQDHSYHTPASEVVENEACLRETRIKERKTVGHESWYKHY